MWLSTLEIGAEQFRSVTEIALKSPFLCVKRSPTRYGLRTGTKVIRYPKLKSVANFRRSSLRSKRFQSSYCAEVRAEA